ncbi:ferrochelatase [Rubricoccus marinus]|uniref:Ferrochelatase n=1 Tax=Rubricoccus marinus TaxID=716817 RepID=A0A259U2V1_9BACT|nr:ferrochelatase [Rubricoccus marinus]OZC04158.1 ferrochelatase [Rubricoccus marinus]
MPTPPAKPIGVLFMAYGGPESLDEIAGYLSDIRHGRPTTTAVLDEITNNYRMIGGKSPIMGLTKAQIDGAMAHLNPPGEPERFKAYLGMRHWAPWIEETVGQMLDDGIEQAVAIVLAPHFSSMSIAKYQAKVKAGLELYRGDIEFSYVDAYFDADLLIDAFAARVREGIEAFPEEEQDEVHVVLSAHSLPVRILREGDPYQDQLWTTARLIAERAGLREDQWSWSYQSEGRSPEPWLGPQLEDHVPTLQDERGIDKVVSLAIGFVSDHVEILFDIDIEAQKAAKERGMTLVRPPSLNDDPRFVRLIAELVEGQAAEAGWIASDVRAASAGAPTMPMPEGTTSPV